jgi:hypothetical protein
MHVIGSAKRSPSVRSNTKRYLPGSSGTVMKPVFSGESRRYEMLSGSGLSSWYARQRGK